MLTLRQPLAAPQPLHAMASQAFPLLSHANLGVLPLARDPPASLEIMPLSTPRLTADALDDFQAALMVCCQRNFSKCHMLVVLHCSPVSISHCRILDCPHHNGVHQSTIMKSNAMCL